MCGQSIKVFEYSQCDSSGCKILKVDNIVILCKYVGKNWNNQCQIVIEYEASEIALINHKCIIMQE